MHATTVLAQQSPEADIAAFVDTIRRTPERRDELVALLPERHPLYAGRGTNATIRLRGYMLAAFEQVGLPVAALPFVLEELESGRDAYLVAAAAQALRGLEQPSSMPVPYLLAAIQNIRYVDDALSFAAYQPRWPLPHYTTALAEIFATFAWLGPAALPALPTLEALRGGQEPLSTNDRTALTHAISAIQQGGADCCTLPEQPLPCCAAIGESSSGTLDSCHCHERGRAMLTDVTFEDQDGQHLAWEAWFGQRPTVVTFFYTRCTNPNKCSLTITKLARLQQAIAAAGLRDQIQTAAITYDPGFDLPARLRAYGENRAVTFDEHNRLLRTVTGFEALQDIFQLGVSFGPSVVNRHRIELFILDRAGAIAVTYARLQWDVEDVLTSAIAVLHE